MSEEAIASLLRTRVDNTADRYTGSSHTVHDTFVDLMPALVASVGSICGGCVRHGAVRAK